MSRFDALSRSVRANLSEATIWLASIWSWLTPWSWWIDTIVILAVGLANLACVIDVMSKEKKG